MAQPSKSSIRVWLAWDKNTPPAIVEPCRLYVEYEHLSNGSIYEGLSYGTIPADCTLVCNDSSSIFNFASTNLVTCGIWTEMISLKAYLGPQVVIRDERDVSSFFRDSNGTDLLEPFHSVGLTRGNTEIHRYADIISSCLIDIYGPIQSHFSAAEGSVPMSCTRNQLFPFVHVGSDYEGGPLERLPSEMLAVNTCVHAICSPRTLSSDIAGIGVRFVI